MPEDTQATPLLTCGDRLIDHYILLGCGTRARKEKNPFLCLESRLIILTMNKPFSMYPYHGIRYLELRFQDRESMKSVT